MHKIASLLIALAASLTPAHADAIHGTDVEFIVRGDHFYLTFVQYYPATVKLTDIYKSFNDPALATGVSNLITKSKRGADKTPGQFRLETTATKFHFDKTTVNICTETVTDTKWTRLCKLDEKNETNRDFFVGGTGNNTIQCVASAENTRCTFKIDSRTKRMRFPLRRSPQRLAAAGAFETIHDTGAIYLSLTRGLKAKEAKSKYESSQLAQYLKRVYDDTHSLESSGKLKGKTLVLKASDRTATYNLVTEASL